MTKPKTIGKSGIEWCERTWNPVVGCTYGCDYCYAQKLVKRFLVDVFAGGELRHSGQTGGIPENYWKLYNFEPTFLNHAFKKALPRKPSSIFFTGLTDPADWEEWWLQKIFQKIKEHPQHTFLMLTKRPNTTYSGYVEIPDNVALGITAITNDDIEMAMETFIEWHEYTRFLSIEPFVNEIDPDYIDQNLVDLVIVGGLSGQPKRTRRCWIDTFRRYHKYIWNGSVRLFEKKNLGYDAPEPIRELPWVCSKGSKK